MGQVFAPARAGSTTLRVAKTADSSFANTNVLADDTQLKFLNVPAGTYSFDAFLIPFSASGTPGFKFAMFISNAPTVSQYAYTTVERNNGPIAADSAGDVFAVAPAPTGTLNIIINGVYNVTVRGMVVVAAVSNITLQWAQAVADATNTTLKRGSWLELGLIS